MNQREKLASENGMAIEFVNWFFDHKKDGCGNVWFMMMAAMWEGWSAREAQVKQLTDANQQLRDETLKSTSALYDVVAENVGMDSFVEAMLAIAWQGGSADGSDIQELALKCGLIRQEVYCADEHENLVDDPGNFEDGDALYFRIETPATDPILALLAERDADKKRIAELEARTVSVKLPETSVGEAGDFVSNAEVVSLRDLRNLCDRAGIKLEVGE